jgi:hypothetical protein
MTMLWTGVSKDIKGYLQFSNLNKADVELRLSFGDPLVKCAGNSMAKSGNWEKGEVAKGVWYVKCDDTKSITGTYESPSPGNGIGTGMDTDGRGVVVVYGREVGTSSFKTAVNDPSPEQIEKIEQQVPSSESKSKVSNKTIETVKKIGGFAWRLLQAFAVMDQRRVDSWNANPPPIAKTTLSINPISGLPNNEGVSSRSK